ncbi:tetratricopeptide repeat protein [Stieleria varia]|uniref:Tetratricopeptide repeat protein n=1 Tax=Stieleria varia TaxID=2528005 RepID=A0A5C6ARG1_9BACT|nr:tetratricopeptide repeat protein [Stieleria varia]TWU02148.1 Tetratricopeptide repeat protein [Stieleria varia]
MAYLSPGGANRSAADAHRLAERGMRHIETALKRQDDSFTGELEKAIDAFKRSLAIQPDNPTVFYHYGFACFMMLDVVEETGQRIEMADEAIRRFKQLMVIEEDQHLMDLLGGVLFRRGTLADSPEERLKYFEDSIDHLQRLLACEPEDEELRGKTWVSLALCHAHRAVNSSPDAKRAGFLTAVDCFEKGIELDGLDLSMRYNYANALMDVGKWTDDPGEKMQWFERSLEVHRDSVTQLDVINDPMIEVVSDEVMTAIQTGTAEDFRYNYACLLSLMGQPDRAIGVLREIIAENPQRVADVINDPDFESLHESSDYQELIADGTT